MDDQSVGQRPQRQFEITARRPRRARNAQLSDDEAGIKSAIAARIEIAVLSIEVF
jgi:hypothetical protein